MLSTLFGKQINIWYKWTNIPCLKMCTTILLLIPYAPVVLEEKTFAICTFLTTFVGLSAHQSALNYLLCSVQIGWPHKIVFLLHSSCTSARIGAHPSSVRGYHCESPFNLMTLFCAVWMYSTNCVVTAEFFLSRRKCTKNAHSGTKHHSLRLLLYIFISCACNWNLRAWCYVDITKACHSF